MEAKHIKDIQEAYASVYGQSQQEFLSEGEGVETQTQIPPMKSSGSTGGKPQPQLPKRTPENAKKVEYYKDDVDLFDLVKGHLLDEGYADTEEAAIVIMANMSESWKQDIVEAKYGTKAGRKALAKKIRKGEKIGKSGPGTGFKAVEKAAKEGGAEDPEAVAAAAMWKTHGGKKG